MKRMSRVMKFLAALAFACVMGVASTSAMAIDRLTLKDGRVLEGEVTRKLEGYVWFKHKVGSIEREEMFTPTEIGQLTEDVPVADASEKKEGSAASVPTPAATATQARESRTPRAAIITMGDNENGNMVGMYMTAEILRRMIPLLEQEKVNVVVLRFNSGGGYLLEIQRMSDVIENEYKPRFRTVAWIESAISAAAMTAHTLEEIYFTPQGNYGACTGFSGALNAVKGRGLEEVLYMMEKISARGKHDPKIMRAMQISADPQAHQALQISDPTGALSANIDENGDVTWFQDTTSGEYVINPKGEQYVLTFVAPEAEKFKFSRGTAATLDQLAKLMKYEEIEWVGEKRPGFAWPISKAEAENINFRKGTKRDEENLRAYWNNYQRYIAAAAGEQDRAERGKFVGRARQQFNLIKAMVRNNHNFQILTLNLTDEGYQRWLEEQEKLLRDLMR